ncbi:MAG: T9SS type A sorting domain-containing protein [Bacteroidota bacterium]
MKTRILIICFVALLLNITKISAQITLEHVYPTPTNRFQLIKLSAVGQKYVIESQGKPYILNFYNLDHSLYKTISIPVDTSHYILSNANISDHLFNGDDQVEILVSEYWSSTSRVHRTRVYNENLNVIFSEDSVDVYGILNTINGYKLSLYDFTHKIKIYSLPGTLPALVKPISKEENIANPFPNPASTRTVIPYALPDGVYKGEIIFSDINGKEVKRFTVTDAFNTLEINDELENGTYFYHLQTTEKSSGAKKLVIIK